jgi:ribosome-binding protein aMBF1 (putative translation factor)
VTWTVTFYNERVEAEILAFPTGLLARFLRYAERMETFGPDLGMPHKRAMGGGLFNMTSTLKQFKARAFARPSGKQAYDDLAEEFAFLDEVLKARAEAGLSQAEVAARVGTTQSAIARLESATPKHSPSIATLRRYARALGYKLEVRLVKEERLRTTRSRQRKAGTPTRRSP